MATPPPTAGVPQSARWPAWCQDILAFINTGNPDPKKIAQFVTQLGGRAVGDPLSYEGPEPRTVGHRLYDAIITDMFLAVMRGVSREGLLREVITRLDDPEVASRALCYFVLEGWPARQRNTAPQYRIIDHARLDDHVWANYARDSLHTLSPSPFLKAITEGREPVELWYAPWIFSYAGEFDLLARAMDRRTVQRGYWISAIPLPAGRDDQPDRTMIALYPNGRSDLEPTPSGGANQELRLFHFLGLAYQVLNHQLANVADEIHGQRQALLASVAPGLMHHEIGTQTGVMMPLVDVVQAIARRWVAGVSRDDDPDRLVRAEATLRDAASRVQMITDAFNNLETRRVRQTVQMATLINQVEVLCHHRLVKWNVSLTWSVDDLAVTFTSDPTLLFHVLVNIVINAVNAFETQPSSEDPRQIDACRGNPADPALPVVLHLRNNGPAIAPPLLDRIFEKGFTTRSHGHGQGLYIARLIAQALGGRLRALAPNEIEPGWTVCFRLELPATLDRAVDFAAERTSK